MKNLNRRRVSAIALVAVLCAALAGCSMGTAESNAIAGSVADDAANAGLAYSYYQKAQPTGVSDYSQYRQTLEEVETALAAGVNTWTVATEMGVPEPMFECPSIGPRVPENATLTPPVSPQPVDDVGDGNSRADHLEILPTVEPRLGVFLGDGTNGTYVVCVLALPDGSTYNYVASLEMNANQFTIPVKYDEQRKRIVPDVEAFMAARDDATKKVVEFTNCQKNPERCKRTGDAPPKLDGASPETGG